jgi:serine-type D-Ala-D-Ala endopeptidase (penicillin-binding protein 7)
VALAGRIRAITLLRWSLAATLVLTGAATGDAAPAKRAATKASKGGPGPGKPRPQKIVVVAATTRTGVPNVQAQGALVLDENGREIFARRPDVERPIASISKLAAALVVVDRGLDLDGRTTISKGDCDVARGGARSRLLQGMTLSNRDLLHAALMGSDNRAVPALGRAVKLGPAELARAMTAKARALGLKHTRFRDPTGLSIENVSTPRETIGLLKAVMAHPVLGPIAARIEYDAHPVDRPPVRYFNTHRPATRSNVQVLGGKTGYNNEARYCLVLGARIEGRPYYMSFLANEGKLTRFGDGGRGADWVPRR